MSLKSRIMPAIIVAMKAKDKVALETLRAVKAELMTAETAAGATGEMSESEEVKLLMKLLKQRKDAAAIYIEQGRADLADDEMAQTKILDQFLPQQMSAEELENAVANIIVKVGAKGPADMGKVMGVTSKELAGKAEGRAIADTVKALLNK
ncbi:MAG: hypothetical protein ACI9B2_000190 [Flavobacteriales bacterium]|jgi:uncharacterized protein YqeY|tara:strand:- start:11 stop:463 length:453 start_codon:yes stop_codon:yes gene_type:complete